MKRIQPNSDAHVLLMLARSLRSFTVADIREMSPKRFDQNRKVSRVLGALSRSGFVAQGNGNMWHITGAGVSALNLMAAPA